MDYRSEKDSGFILLNEVEQVLISFKNLLENQTDKETFIMHLEKCIQLNKRHTIFMLRKNKHEFSIFNWDICCSYLPILESTHEKLEYLDNDILQ